jgi:hypothetical protein
MVMLEVIKECWAVVEEEIRCRGINGNDKIYGGSEGNIGMNAV